MVLAKPKRLKDQFFDKCQMMGRSYKTAEVYWEWCVRFMRFDWQRRGGRDSDWVHPKDMGRVEIEYFLSHLPCPASRNPRTHGALEYHDHGNLSACGTTRGSEQSQSVGSSKGVNQVAATFAAVKLED